MIYLNGREVKVTKFPNGELKIDLDRRITTEYNDIGMVYQSSDDIVTLMFVKAAIDNTFAFNHTRLYVGYMPYSRMDRSENHTTLFTLKYLCKIINDLNFRSVLISESHSSITTALLDRCIEYNTTYGLIRLFLNTDSNLTDFEKHGAFILPDAGAQKRYAKQLPYQETIKSFTVEKSRNFETGEITSIQLNDEIPENINKFIIVDDLCSRGGTFLGVIEAIKEKTNRDDIEFTLIVAHCEDTILDGSLIHEPTLTKVLTTNSIIQQTKNPKIDIVGMDHVWTNF